VNPQAADVTGLELQVGDHVHAFYHGGNDLDDIVVDYASQSLQAGNKCGCFADWMSSVRDEVPGELMTREGVLPSVAEDDAYLPGGSFSHDALLGAAEAVVTSALGDGYQRVWALGNVSFVVRSARPEDVLGRGLGPDRVRTELPAVPHVPGATLTCSTAKRSCTC
jgi:hypothetical protein